MDNQPKLLAQGFSFPESPRWHDDKLWFVDMFGRKAVLTVDLNGRMEVAREFEDSPSGLGFLPDGTAIVVLTFSKQIVRVDTGETYADLSEAGGSNLNDMVVDAKGNAYVDHIASVGDEPGDSIILVEANGKFRSVADGLHRPNGMVVSPDGQTLVVGSVPGKSLTAFTISEDGSLSDRRLFADASPRGCNGIALDAEGAIWVGSGGSDGNATTGFFRIREGGEVADSIIIEGKSAVACALGGPERKTLFMTTARVPSLETDKPWRTEVSQIASKWATAEGFIEAVDVDVAGAGFP
jgi:sugar lactone lactonase YvrE